MAQRRQEIEAFVRRLVGEVETAKAAGITVPQAIADLFNAKGITTHKGRQWTGATVVKFIISQGAKLTTSGGNAGRASEPMGNPNKPSSTLDTTQLHRISERNIGHYDRAAKEYWESTRNHDVSQNCEALLAAIKGDPPYAILDLGCGPGRDLDFFRSLGHDTTGLDGSKEFVTMARQHSGCNVLHQDFLAMKLPTNRFDGIYANASLFHVPSQELPRVLAELTECLKPRGILFTSNPRGNNEEGISGDRYSCFFDLTTWRNYVTAAGFIEVGHYYRPPGLPRYRQSWLATVLRKG
jgi:SAM-dependent methyltransferase